jgi:dolichol-phosphate mannosyltransferase
VTAGMDYSSGDAVIIIDADLQDPPEVIPEMIAKWKEGYDVVYGVRKKRQGETFFKLLTAKVFYRFMKKMTSVDMPLDTGDFRLIDRKVCEALKRVNEKNRYIRGIISWLGYKQTGVEYVRDKRFAGETKYPLKKMLRLAANGITSFSDKPLKLATGTGITVIFLSLLYALIMLILKLATSLDIAMWNFLFAAAFLLNGVTLTILGIFGEYIGRIYDETKNRPLYLIGELLNFDEGTEILTDRNKK